MSGNFPKPKPLGTNVKIELDLSNHVTKTDLNLQQELIHHILLKRLI